jgi:hypothetical protein
VLDSVPHEDRLDSVFPVAALLSQEKMNTNAQSVVVNAAMKAVREFNPSSSTIGAGEPFDHPVFRFPEPGTKRHPFGFSLPVGSAILIVNF